MKKIESNYSWKGLLCLVKWHLDNPEEQGEVESPPNRKLLLHFQSKLRKKLFRKKAFFNKAFNPQTLYHSEIDPD